MDQRDGRALFIGAIVGLVAFFAFARRASAFIAAQPYLPYYGGAEGTSGSSEYWQEFDPPIEGEFRMEQPGGAIDIRIPGVGTYNADGTFTPDPNAPTMTEPSSTAEFPESAESVLSAPSAPIPRLPIQ